MSSKPWDSVVNAVTELVRFRKEEVPEEMMSESVKSVLDRLCDRVRDKLLEQNELPFEDRRERRSVLALSAWEEPREARSERVNKEAEELIERMANAMPPADVSENEPEIDTSEEPVEAVDTSEDHIPDVTKMVDAPVDRPRTYFYTLDTLPEIVRSTRVLGDVYTKGGIFWAWITKSGHYTHIVAYCDLTDGHVRHFAAPGCMQWEKAAAQLVTFASERDYQLAYIDPDNVLSQPSTEPSAPSVRKYRDEHGKTLEVGQGLNDGGFMTLRGRHRVKSNNLPVRETYEEAQADLDVYATKHGLVEVSDE